LLLRQGSACLHGYHSRASERGTGSPAVKAAWHLDPNQVKSYLGDAGRLVLVGGTRLPDGRNAFGRDLFQREFIEFWPYTSGFVWDDGTGGRQPPTGWWFVFWDSGGPTMLQTISVDRDCFVDYGGDGSTSMLVNPIHRRVGTTAFARGDEFWCDYEDRSNDTGPGVTGLPSAAITMAGIDLAGWGFGEYVSIEQSKAHGQPSRVVARDQQCDARGVGVVASAFAMQYGTVPPLFVGKLRDAKRLRQCGLLYEPAGWAWHALHRDGEKARRNLLPHRARWKVHP
jgi:hypothetical protein